MVLEKNPKTRLIAKHLLRLEDKIDGKPFAGMTRAREISNYSCGSATMEMLLSYVGVKTTQTKLIKSIRAQNKIKLYGLDVNDLAKITKIAGKKELVFWRKHHATINDLVLAINKFKYPVGVEWQGDFYEDEDEYKGHYAVVTKIVKKSGFLRMSDPYFNTFFGYKDLDRKYKISDFVKMWWDTNEIRISNSKKTKLVKDTKVMFVVTKKGDSWPKKLGMRRV